MAARVTNFGLTRQFPTRVGNVFVAALQTVIMDDDKAAAEMGKFSEVEVTFLTKPFPPGPSEPDLMRYPINFLRRIAHRKGIPGTFSMKKAEIISKLKETTHEQ
jgi:hypothetical protein